MDLKSRVMNMASVKGGVIAAATTIAMSVDWTALFQKAQPIKTAIASGDKLQIIIGVLGFGLAVAHLFEKPAAPTTTNVTIVPDAEKTLEKLPSVKSE